MLKVDDRVSIAESEVDIRGIRASGPGGQNVNKVASAAHLRFDIRASSLPEHYKHRLLELRDRRITADGILNIKAQKSRAYEANRAEALQRLLALLARAGQVEKPRKRTKPSRAARQRRLDQKTRRAHVKTLRRRVTDRD